MTMRESILAILAGLMTLSPAAAAQQVDLPAPLSEEELGGLRGGFTIDGITFEFGAIARTSINGANVLETRLTWTPDGVEVSDVSSLAPVTIPGIGGRGLIIEDETGSTAVGHRLLDGLLQGFIVNTGNDRNIRQDLEVTLTLPGFEAMQRDFVTSRLGFRLDQDVGAGLMRSSMD